MEKYQVAIVIPAFNEELTIFKVVQLVKKYGLVIVVNDASTDRTQQLSESAGAITITHSNNKGYDGALNSGFLKAKELDCRMIITFDADGQHDAKLLEKYIQLIDNGCQVVTGVRDKFQRLAEHVFSWVTRFKWGIVDPLCGMKAYDMNIYNDLGHFDSYNSIGTELLIFASKKSIDIEQLPIMINKRSGKPRFGNRISSNIKIFKAIFYSLKQ